MMLHEVQDDGTVETAASLLLYGTPAGKASD